MLEISPDHIFTLNHKLWASHTLLRTFVIPALFPLILRTLTR